MAKVLRSGKPILLPGGVRAISTRAAIEPGVVGWARPVLLLPAGIDECLDTPQWRAVLAHELCHIRRRDNLTAALHMLTEALFWFHPLVWWIGARMLDERERACDEAVLAEGNTPRTYAEGIVNVCKRYARSPIPCVAGVAGSDLKKRIEDIFMNRASVRLSVSKKALLATAGALAVASPVLVGMLGAGLGVVGLPTLAAQTASTTSAATMPVRISGPEPDYTEQARAARWGGTVLLSVTIDAAGVPKDIRIVRALGMGLDEKAIEAVRQWRFRAATKDGVAVATTANLEVAFHPPNAAGTPGPTGRGAGSIPNGRGAIVTPAAGAVGLYQGVGGAAPELAQAITRSPGASSATPSVFEGLPARHATVETSSGMATLIVPFDTLSGRVNVLCQVQTRPADGSQTRVMAAATDSVEIPGSQPAPGAYRANFRLETGSYKLKMIVREVVSGRMFTEIVDFDIP